LILAGNLELQPSAPGQSHFGLESKQTVGFKRLDSPEIDRVSDAEIGDVTTTATQPYAAD
jgi:hypothetical protein